MNRMHRRWPSFLFCLLGLAVISSGCYDTSTLLEEDTSPFPVVPEGDTTDTASAPPADSDSAMPIDTARDSTGSPDDTEPRVGEYEIGTLPNSSWTATQFFRGNEYLSTRGGRLGEFSMWLRVDAPCTLDFYVHHREEQGGPVTVLWSASRAVPANGQAYYSSGPIDVAITSGEFYGLGGGWSCQLTYFMDDDPSWFGYDTGIGEFVWNYWDNDYPFYDPAFAPSGTGASEAYRQRVSMVE